MYNLFEKIISGVMKGTIKPLILFYLLLSQFSIGNSYAQDLNDEVNLHSPYLQKLELLTYGSVNKLRTEIKLPGLIWDDVLYRAAKDHADYLIHEKRISHFQTVPGKETPYERVKIHGGLTYTATGENIIKVTLGVEIAEKGIRKSTVTYNSSADAMAQLWRNSPGHYKNIISTKFNCTAIATSYDSTSQQLIAVQVFAYSDTPNDLSNQPDFSSYLLKAPKPKLPFGLKGYLYKKEEQKDIRGFMNLKMDQGHLSGSFKKAKKIFKGRRSGIVQEYIPLSQYDSASRDFSMAPNRRNAQFELNGTLQKPVYRRTMLRYSRKFTNRKYYNFRFFKKVVELPIKKPTTQFVYPLIPNGYGWEFNLFLIKKKRLNIHRTYTSVPGALFDRPFPKLKFINSFTPFPDIQKFRHYQQYDTLNFEFYYPSGEVIVPFEVGQEVKEALSHLPGKIIAVYAEAYASIEGEKSENEKLAQKRLSHFMQLVKPYSDTLEVQPKVLAREQWKLFSSQIEATHLQHLKDMKMEEVRRYVNANKEDTVLLKMLNAQRYTTIKLVVKQDFKEPIALQSVQEVYDSLKREIERFKKPNKNLVNAMEQAQLALYFDITQMDPIPNVRPEIPKVNRNLVFDYHDLIFRYTVLQQVDEISFYNELHRLGRSKGFPNHLRNQLIFNNHVLIYNTFFFGGDLSEMMNCKKLYCFPYRNSEINLNKYKKIRCKEEDLADLDVLYYVLKHIPRMIKLSQSEGISDFPEEELWKYYYLYTVHSLYRFVPPDQEIFSLLPGFKQHFHPNDDLLNEEERLKLGYFYCAILRYKTAKTIIEPISINPEPNKQALKLYLTLIPKDYQNTHDFAERLIKEFPRLGKEEWCDLWYNPNYLNFLMLEDLKLKDFYNCNCNK